MDQNAAGDSYLRNFLISRETFAKFSHLNKIFDNRSAQNQCSSRPFNLKAIDQKARVSR
jgi:hypothetical protein